MLSRNGTRYFEKLACRREACKGMEALRTVPSKF